MSDFEEQKKAVDQLQELLELEDGLLDSELKWVEKFSRVEDRPFQPREIRIINDIYDAWYERQMDS